MAKSRFSGNYLKLSTDRYPAPAERVVDMSTLNGGLNLWELDYKIGSNQSPNMENMWWENGALSSRGGQAHLYNPEAEGHTEDNYGDFYACYEKEWGNLTHQVIVHKGTHLYAVDVEEHGTGTYPGRHVELCSGMLQQKGLFFVFGEYLYYMNGCTTNGQGDITSNVYVKIDADGNVTNVVPYVPVVMVNRKPDGTAGQEYQPENRLASGKEIHFTADGSSTVYYLPYKNLDSSSVTIVTGQITINSVWTDVTFQECEKYAARSSFPATGRTGVIYIVTSTTPNTAYKWDSSTSDYVLDTLPDSYKIFVVDMTNGTLTFDVAPTNTTSATPNNIQVVCHKGDDDLKKSIYQCRCVATYGSSNAITVVFGGPNAQPNAYFWCGNDSTGVRPDYFPYEYYNLAGTADEYITAFNKQQGMLVIFKEHSIGKTKPDDTSISERTYISLPYTPVNDRVGCDVPGSIQLVNNNLIFANTYSGVYILLDSTAAGENNVDRLSRNVNGNSTRGLLRDLFLGKETVTSFDDDQRYWLVCNDHAYIWDYSIKSYNTYYGTKEETLSWFYLTNILARGWAYTDTDNVYFKENGALVHFTSAFCDFPDELDASTGEPYPFPRSYTFATQYFGTYEALKDITKVILAISSTTNAYLEVKYSTNWESDREDKTPLESSSYSLAPRDLSYRNLTVQKFTAIAVRTPRCFHIHHFSMTISNDRINTDMTVVHAQIFYKYSREER